MIEAPSTQLKIGISCWNIERYAIEPRSLLRVSPSAGIHYAIHKTLLIGWLVTDEEPLISRSRRRQPSPGSETHPGRLQRSIRNDW
jgi:hypothetical protein